MKITNKKYSLIQSAFREWEKFYILYYSDHTVISPQNHYTRGAKIIDRVPPYWVCDYCAHKYFEPLITVCDFCYRSSVRTLCRNIRQFFTMFDTIKIRDDCYEISVVRPQLHTIEVRDILEDTGDHDIYIISRTGSSTGFNRKILSECCSANMAQKLGDSTQIVYQYGDNVIIELYNYVYYGETTCNHLVETYQFACDFGCQNFVKYCHNAVIKYGTISDLAEVDLL